MRTYPMHLAVAILFATALALGPTTPASAQTSNACDFTYVLTYGCSQDGTGWAMISNYKGPLDVEYHWDGDEASGGLQVTGLSNGSHFVSIFDGVACETAEYFSIDCSTVPDNCQFRTQTQGGWGTGAHGNNPGVYRNAHFASAFPNGLTIGCFNRLRLTSAAAVDDFLPSGTTARPLNAGLMVDPGQSYRNVLAGQLVALTLSVGFDAADPAFSPSNMSLANVSIATGTFHGWTVQMLLDEANHFIGGCSSSYTASQLNSALTMVNENYDDGTLDQGNLTCTPSKRAVDPSTVIKTYPVPASDMLWVDLGLAASDVMTVSIIDATGRVVERITSTSSTQGGPRAQAIDVQGLNNGSYLLSVEQGAHVTTQHILIIH